MLKENSIFYALYYGGVAPWENSELHLSKEYKATLDKANELQEKVSTLLNDEGKQFFEDFLKIDGKIGGYFEEEKFKEGFILGTRLMMEVLQDNRFSK